LNIELKEAQEASRVSQKTLKSVRGEAAADRFLNMIESDSNGYVTVDEWLRFIRRFKQMNGVVALLKWIHETTESAQKADFSKPEGGGQFRDDGSVGYVPDSKDRPSSHVLSRQNNKLTSEEQKEGKELFQEIYKDGNRRLTAFED